MRCLSTLRQQRRASVSPTTVHLDPPAPSRSRRLAVPLTERTFGPIGSSLPGWIVGRAGSRVAKRGPNAWTLSLRNARRTLRPRQARSSICGVSRRSTAPVVSNMPRCAASTSLSNPARWFRSSVRPVAASRRRSTSSPASTGRPRAPSRWTGTDSTRWTRSSSRHGAAAGWGSSSSSSSCCRHSPRSRTPPCHAISLASGAPRSAPRRPRATSSWSGWATSSTTYRPSSRVVSSNGLPSLVRSCASPCCSSATNPPAISTAKRRPRCSSCWSA